MSQSTQIVELPHRHYGSHIDTLAFLRDASREPHVWPAYFDRTEYPLIAQMMNLQSRVTIKPFGVSSQPIRHALPARAVTRRGVTVVNAAKPDQKPSIKLPETATLFGAAGLLTPLLLDVESALAQKGELGIIEGRIASLTHPAIEGFLFVASLYTAWLGFQWR